MCWLSPFWAYLFLFLLKMGIDLTVKMSPKKVGLATLATLSMASGATVAGAANITPSTPKPECVASTFQPEFKCPDWADEFNGTEVNTAFWNVYNGYSEAKQDPYGRYTKDAVSVKDGKLHLTTKVGANGQKGNSAEMTTNNKVAFEDGYWEYSLSYTGYGHVGGYLYGNGNVAGPQLGEVDGFEAFGATDNSTRSEAGKNEKFQQADKNQSVIHFSQAAIDAQSGKKTTHTKAVWMKNKAPGESVVVGILKNSDGVKIFRDGVLVDEFKSSDPNYALTFPEGQPLNMTLTARVSNVYWGVQDNPTGGISVDYVRHYPLVTAEPEPTPTPESTPSDTPAPEPTPTVEPAPSETPAPAPTTDKPTPIPEPTSTTPAVTPEPTVDPTPTPEPTPTAPEVTPEPSAPVTPAPVPAPSESTTPVPTVEPTLAPSPSSPVVTPTPEPTVSEPPTPAPTESPKSENPAPSAEPTTSTSPTPVATPTTEAPKVEVTPTPESTKTPEPLPSVTEESPAPKATPSTSESPVATPKGASPSATTQPSADSTPTNDSASPVKRVEAKTGHDTQGNIFAIGAVAVGFLIIAGFAVYMVRKSKRDSEEE
jgi:singapore isolate B (sub-type 7) whole genome shotgun sequence assembly, scaffold_18